MKAKDNPFDKPKSNSSFDVDELVKRIDAKIAELEEEERLEKEKEKEKKKLEADDSDKDFDVTETYEKSKPVSISDDQFFDDFFDE